MQENSPTKQTINISSLQPSKKVKLKKEEKRKELDYKDLTPH